MANVIINDTHLNNIADSIRSKNGTNTKYKPSEMATAISNIPVGEDVTIEVTQQNDLIVAQSVTIDDIKLALQNKSAGGGEEIVLQEKTITPTKSSQTITPDENYDGLSKVTVNPIGEEYVIPTGTLEITSNGTHDVTNYASATVDIPNEDLTSELNTYEDYLTTQETTIDDIALALQNKIAGGGDTLEIARSIIDKSITSYVDDQLTEIGTYMFYNCSKFIELNTPNVTEIGGYAFQGSKVKTMYFPKLTIAVANVFRNAKSIENLDLPNCTELGNASIHSCIALKIVNFPKVEKLVRACMSGCTSLEYIDLPVCTRIETQAFYNCSSLKTLILRSETVCTLVGTDAFSGCTSLESIYVQDALLTQYQEETNWITFADKIKPLSELEG